MLATAPFKICDSIHGFIRFGDIEKKVIDSRFFQRLRYIRQMGVAYLIYPGATHTRFEHSLGVMELVTRCYASMLKSDPKTLPKSEKELDYWRTVLRLAALCHDMGHLPFSHTAESILPDGGHEEMTIRIIQSPEMKAIWKELGEHAEEDIITLSVGKRKQELSPWEKVLSQAITEDNFGADRIDYLIRDATYTGVGYGHFDYHQLIDTLRIMPDLTLGVLESGLQSVESLWIARYLMYARVYHHPKARLYTFHMRRFMERHYKTSGAPHNDLECYLRQCDYHVLTALRAAADAGDVDALALLKEGPSYVYVDKEASIKSLQAEFGERVSLDTASEKEINRDFPVLQDNQVVNSSKNLSPFLSNIPTGKKSILYIPEELK